MITRHIGIVGEGNSVVTCPAARDYLVAQLDLAVVKFYSCTGHWLLKDGNASVGYFLTGEKARFAARIRVNSGSEIH